INICKICCINHSWIYSSFDSCNCDANLTYECFGNRFPKNDPERRKQWIINMKCKGWNPQQNHRVCSVHFEDKYICGRDIRQRLTPDAVPTIFDYPKNFQKKVLLIQPLTFSSFVAQLGLDVLRKLRLNWHMFIGAELSNFCSKQTFSYFHHIDLYRYYILSPILTQIKDAWEWLVIDIRGPLPLTLNGHQYVLTLTDFYSKWVEAFPLRCCSSTEVAQHVAEVISHFGFPFGILINVALKSHLKLSGFSLLYRHRQVGSLDLTTQTLISRMVSDLVNDHPYNWDVCLPAKVFSLCFKEHPKTKQRPFSLLCCKGPQPVTTPRDLSVSLLFSYRQISTGLMSIARVSWPKQVSSYWCPFSSGFSTEIRP
uniref:THAP-type domain-containing protein n=1 Tax=Oncorhynchus tshawytscha TaxID=74940 RepID=A0A8C8D0R4_ONCTS